MPRKKPGCKGDVTKASMAQILQDIDNADRNKFNRKKDGLFFEEWRTLQGRTQKSQFQSSPHAVRQNALWLIFDLGLPPRQRSRVGAETASKYAWSWYARRVCISSTAGMFTMFVRSSGSLTRSYISGTNPSKPSTVNRST